jgi:hypothetical protein
MIQQLVTFTATVSSSQGLPTGMVTFKKNEELIIGTAALSDGQASIKYAFAGAGTKSITAIYSGDPNFAPSTSPILDQIVKP